MCDVPCRFVTLVVLALSLALFAAVIVQASAHDDPAAYPYNLDEPAPESADPMPTVLRWLGYFHPATVHFPVGLIVAAAAAELLAMARRGAWFGDAARFCTWGAAIGALIATPLGWFNAGWDLAYDERLMALHRWLGTGAMLWMIVLVVLVELASRSGGGRGRWGYRAALLVGVTVVLLAGHYGGSLVYGPDYYHWPP